LHPPRGLARWPVEPDLIAVLLLFALTLFVGAALLFAMQPMVGKMILPLLGGTPAVWSTCMVFFQAALLGGYAYAHASTAWLGPRRQALLHIGVLALPLAVLPLGVDPTLVRGGEISPVLDVLLLLSLSVGLPFFVVSATAPLLQAWFAHTGHPAAGDPYFLYAASNLGSMLALLAYPVLIEPRLPLRAGGWLSQTQLWSLGYLLLAALVVACALALWRVGPERARASSGATRPPGDGLEPHENVAFGGHPVGDRAVRARRLTWVALAFVPSSLLLGATTYITTDLAAIPLLWVLPLAIYLMSFILAFGWWPAALQRAVVTATLPVVLLAIFSMIAGLDLRLWITVLWHLAVLLVVALACHGALALDRPPPRRLTEFYFLISVGGVLGGLFNALIAPLVFTSLVEYPLVMVLGCVLLAPRRGPADSWPRRVIRDVAWALGVTALAFVLYAKFVVARIDFAVLIRVLGLPPAWDGDGLHALQRTLNTGLTYGVPLVVAVALWRRPPALALALTGVLVVAGFVAARNEDQIRRARSFFGTLQVTRDRGEGGYTELRHGTTLHGRQSVDPKRRGEPLSYYHRAGPIAQLFAELDRRGGMRRVAVIGLGTGTLAAYARTGDTMTFYEIDPVVRTVAADPAYFTYVTDARNRAALLRVELGDARVRLDAVRRERPGERYDLLIVDAFTSDAIPVHLLTREALRLYFEVLAPDGLLALHLSNRYLRLEPVVGNLVEDAGLGGRLLQHDDAPETEGANRSTWAVLARRPEALGALARDERWTTATLDIDPGVGTWTDDFHNVLSVFKW
jgi:spermidine synthase